MSTNDAAMGGSWKCLKSANPVKRECWIEGPGLGLDDAVKGKLTLSGVGLCSWLEPNVSGKRRVGAL